MRLRPFEWTLVAWLFAAPAAMPQSAPIVRTGNTEIGGFVGSSFGIDKVRIMGGGNIAYALTRVIMPYGEFSYFPGIGRRIDVPLAGGRSARFNFSVPLADFHGGVHLRVPLKESRIIPYGVIGVGVVHSLQRTERARISDPLGSFDVDVPVPARSDFAVNGGGGLRFYLHERFGLRVEAKVYKPTGQFTDVFGKVEGGFFFQVK